MAEQEIGVGVIGCGGFGLFALQHFTQIAGVRLMAMAGTHRPAAYATARRFGIPDIQEVEALVSRDDIQLVYISTPPFLHHLQAMQALNAGKHVIVEKPFAMTLQQAEEMIWVAKKNDLLVVANLMQRYNPVFDAVQRLIAAGTLGEFLHGYFENYATDEGLPPAHWFWDRSKSGGIFVEHAVHFFDLFEGWIGPGTVASAQRVFRPGSEMEEQVNCTVRYGSGALVNFYHGFTQPARVDRQELRLLFERGDVTLYEWIPTRVLVHALADEKQARELCELFPGARLDITSVYSRADRSCRGRGKDLDVYEMIEINQGEGVPKMHRYGQLLRSLFEDQVAWIRDRNHVRVVTEENGLRSLKMALDAKNLARE